MLLSRLYLTSASLVSLRAARANHICSPITPFQAIAASRAPIVQFSSSSRTRGEMSNSSYEPFLLSPIPGAERDANGELAISDDWTADLELETVRQFAETSSKEGGPLKVLVLYGSLRERQVFVPLSCRSSYNADY